MESGIQVQILDEATCNSLRSNVQSAASLLREKIHPNKCRAYDIKQSAGEVLVMLEFLGIRSNRSLPSLPGPLCPGMVAHGKVQSMDPMELLDI